MTKVLLRTFFKGVTHDPSLYENESNFVEYVYCEAAIDSRWERQQQLGRIHLAVMLDGAPIGEVILKNLDGKSDALGIHMKNDCVKNRGYGTIVSCIIAVIGKTGIQANWGQAFEENPKLKIIIAQVPCERNKIFILLRSQGISMDFRITQIWSPFRL